MPMIRTIIFIAAVALPTAAEASYFTWSAQVHYWGNAKQPTSPSISDTETPLPSRNGWSCGVSQLVTESDKDSLTERRWIKCEKGEEAVRSYLECHHTLADPREKTRGDTKLTLDSASTVAPALALSRGQEIRFSCTSP